jgi:8-oxo-dGTP pyrophosphatase MutT (NUDIX family)
MEKFSKLKNKVETTERKEKILYEDDHNKIIEFENWSIVNNKDAVICIPFLIEENQIVLRYEYIPTYKYRDNKDYFLTVISGTIEQGESIEEALRRELEEEAGIVLKEGFELDGLEPLYISKGSSNKYFPFLVPLNERDYNEVVAVGDGSMEEKKSKSVKVDAKYLGSLKPSDLITDYMLLKLKEYLNSEIR